MIILYIKNLNKSREANKAKIKECSSTLILNKATYYEKPSKKHIIKIIELA